MIDCAHCKNFEVCDEDCEDEDMEIEEDEEDRLERENEKYAECECGAYQPNRHGQFICVADCVCGKP